jgi:lysylphosphatidylglycerol synthetase-like protein (DUF2156 family)
LHLLAQLKGEAIMAFCQGCGTPIQQTDAVCPNCGMAITNQLQGVPSDKPVIVNVQQPVGVAAIPAPPGNGMSIASLVLGIVALVGSVTICGSIFAIPVALVGLILGIIGKKKLQIASAPFGKATAGIVMSIISLVIAAIVIVFVFVLGIGMANMPRYYRF